MGLGRKIRLVRDSKDIGNIYLLCSFYIDNYESNYIIYAKGDINISDTNIVYFGKLKEEDEKYYLFSISNEEELSYVKKTIKELFKYSLELEEIKRDKIAFNRKLEIPKNIFENPYNDKNDNVDNDIDEMNEEDKSGDNREYRTRLKALADDIKDIKPIDKDVPDTIYVNYYNEMGMLLKSKLSTLKQLWMEYQLIYNEKQVKNKEESLEYNDKTINNLGDVEGYSLESLTKEIEPDKEIPSDFDGLLNSLSNRIENINNYLDELREMKKEMDETDYIESDISEEKEKFRQEKEEFEEYKRREEEKLKDEKRELQVHFNKFQSIVDSFDKKIKEVK